MNTREKWAVSAYPTRSATSLMRRAGSAISPLAWRMRTALPSASCVTGLVPQDTGTYWTTFGQTVIILLIQVGGPLWMGTA